jgi:SAM-dependent methyltransferase
MTGVGDGHRATPDSAPIFVVGIARSGTTMTRLMLNRHSQVAIPPESHFVAALYREFEPDAILEPDAIARALDVVTTSEHWVRDWQSTPHQLRAAIGSPNECRLSDLIRITYETETAPSRKARWGDKTPAYLFQIPRLLQSFPNASVLVTVRDPRDIYLSLRKQGWMGETRHEQARYIARCGGLAKRYAEGFGPSRVRVVRYEDLVAKGEVCLRGITEWLDLPFEPTMLDFHLDAGDHVPSWEFSSGIHTKLHRPPESDDVERWRHELPRRERVEVEAICRNLIEWQGYPTTVSDSTAAVVRSAAKARYRVEHKVRPLAAKALRPARTARSIRARVRRRWRDGTPPRNQWLRTVMIADIEQYLGGLPAKSMDIVECSSTTYKSLGWKSHTSLTYPPFDLCDPPAEHATYDVVVCEQVLEHVPDPVRAARTLHALCRPGGHLIVSTPFMVRVHKAPADYWRFTDDGLRLLLEKAGFEVIAVKMWGNRAVVRASLRRWPAQRRWRSLENVDDVPVVVWAFATPAGSPA